MTGTASLWVITGLSGAGKATALAALERSGVDCVDNLAVDVLQTFSLLPRERPAAAVVDARQGHALERFEVPPGARVLFLDARDDVLVLRLAGSTRPHPCAELGRGGEAVAAERLLLAPMRAAADVVVDTSELRAEELSERVSRMVVGDRDAPAAIRVSLSSFGFKFGLPMDAEWVVDARVVRNPFWVPELRPRTGLDESVRAYVLEDPAAHELIDRAHGMLTWALTNYAERRRGFLHFAAGCTGGRHRSVAVIEALSERLRGEGVDVTVRHRDLDKPDPR